MTATTGMAALQFHKAETIHKWSGIGHGQFSRKQVVHNLLTNSSFSNTRNKLLQTETLMIDEIGMMSSKVFNDIEFICRSVYVADKNYLVCMRMLYCKGRQ